MSLKACAYFESSGLDIISGNKIHLGHFYLEADLHKWMERSENQLKQPPKLISEYK